MARSLFLLPSENGAWAFEVPIQLERCIGRYARIPEFAQNGYLLHIIRQTGPVAT